MIVRVEVKPSLYRWASERSGLDLDELVRRFPKVREWMAGDRVPTLKQIEKFAQATGTAVGYFFLPEPPDEKIPIPDLRTIRDQAVIRPSGNLLDTIYQCQQRQDWYREYARSAGLRELEWIGSLETSTPPTEAARKITRGLSFSVEHRGANWAEAFTNLRNRAEEAGVLVMVNGVVGSNNYRKLDPREFRGFALADDIRTACFRERLRHTCSPDFHARPRTGPHLARRERTVRCRSEHSDRRPRGSLVQPGSSGDARPDAADPFGVRPQGGASS